MDTTAPVKQPISVKQPFLWQNTVQSGSRNHVKTVKKCHFLGTVFSRVLADRPNENGVPLSRVLAKICVKMVENGDF